VAYATKPLRVRAAELVGALSLATDLGTGVPLEQALRTCLLATRLAEEVGVGPAEQRATYYLALLRAIGCSATALDLLDLFGEDVELSAWQGTADLVDPSQALPILIRNVGSEQSALRRAAMLLHVLTSLPRMPAVQRAHCEVGRELAVRLGLGPELHDLFGQIYERWDGKGNPGALRAEAVALPVRLVHVANSAETFVRYTGHDGGLALLQERAGGALDPMLVDRFCARASDLLDGLQVESAWAAVLNAEPGGRTWLDGDALDEALRAVADFADLKSPHTLGHSRGVADLASAAARECGLPAAEVVAVQRAGWLHDVGRVGISATVWQKAGRLDVADWEAVRLHPYYTERVTARGTHLARLGALAALHHERVDGSGYHRGLSGAAVSHLAHILAAADAYQALTEPRPHRRAHERHAAADELRKDVRAGKLDHAAANAVLRVAGQSTASARRTLPAGLSEREVEVLELLARGDSPRSIAERLSITPKTARNHVQNVYAKLGVSTRAAATLFALQHGLVGDSGAR